jgi:hypothetical protein
MKKSDAAGVKVFGTVALSQALVAGFVVCFPLSHRIDVEVLRLLDAELGTVVTADFT